MCVCIARVVFKSILQEQLREKYLNPSYIMDTVVKRVNKIRARDLFRQEFR
jgi:hypothetical protein